MAKLTFSGTTQKVLLALGTDIDADTRITITDNDYTLANLLTIVTGRTFPVVLQKTAAAVEIEGTETELKNMLAGVDKYTGALKVTYAAPGVSATDLNTIAAGTTGKVTATLASDTDINAATVAALKDVKATDAIKFDSDETGLANASEINALLAIKKLIPNADFSKIVTIAADAKDVALVKSVLKDVAPTVAVTINNGDISAADANAIAKATKGVVTATIEDGSVAATLKALANVNASDALTFKSTDTTVKATDLVALNSKIANGTYTSIETITADAKDVSYVSAALAVANNAAVTITGTITAAQANAIANATTEPLTAIVEADTAANLVAKLVNTDTDDKLTLTVNGTTATAAHLNALAGVTGGKIKLDATEVTGLFNDLEGVYDTNKASFIALGNENVTITGPNPTAAELNKIAAATTGKVTATLAPGTTIDADTVADLKDVKASDNITFISTNGGAALNGKDELNALLAIKKIIPNANFVAVKDITGVDAKDAAIVKNVLKVIDPTSDITFNPLTELSAKDANDIAKAITGAGVLTATLKDGSVAATLKALSDISATDKLTFTTTDKSAKASDLVELDALVDLDATSVKTVTGTGDAKGTTDILDALTSLNTTSIPDHPEVKISGIVANDDANIAGILAGTDGKVTAKIAAGTAGVLKATLTGGTDDDALDVTVNGDTALATDLALIDASTGSKVKVDAKEVTGSFAELNALYYTNKANFSNLGNEDVGIAAGAANSALNVDTILKATTGVVTAEVTNDKANILVSQLKNANAKDDLTITVLTDANGTSAKDLIALTKKTNLLVDADNIIAHGIFGSVADINAVIKAQADAKLVLDAAVAYSVTGTITAAQANAIADATNGVVTAIVAADTAAKLVTALEDVTGGLDVLTLKVNGATAAALDLINLNTNKTAGKITVDAKEITGTAANVTTVLTDAGSDFIGKEKAAVRVTDVGAVAANLVDAILAKTTGVVTATVQSGTAADLKAALLNATAKDKLALEVTGAADAADLLALDDKTAVKVDAEAVTAISGSAADVKKLLASKGVDVSKTAPINLSDLVVKAADVSAVAKATSGVVTAKVEADTAAKLNAALTDKDENALTLTVNGATATAKDLISLDGKTSATITLNVGAITGNIAEITKVFTDTATNGFTNEETTAATISGEITAAQANAITTATSGVVTATIKADSAALLNSTLGSALATDALKLTVDGTTATAAHLNALDGKTSVTVNAAAIKNIEGTATAVKAAYDANALKTISGLGNETVDLTTATDANASLVNAINNYTTGVITLPTITLTNTLAATFELEQLGDLKGITELVKIDASTNNAKDTINISLTDLLAANDGKGSIAFAITGDNGGTDTVTFTDVSGWTKVDTGYNAVDADGNIVFTNSTTNQVVTITLTDVIYA